MLSLCNVFGGLRILIMIVDGRCVKLDMVEGRACGNVKETELGEYVVY